MESSDQQNWLAELGQQLSQAEVRESDLLALFHHAPMLMMVLDREAKVRLANTSVTKFTGASPEELFGSSHGQALRCVHHVSNPKGCGFGEHCQRCVLRQALSDTFRLRRGQAGAETSFQFLGPQRDPRVMRITTAYYEREGDAKVLLFVEDITRRRNQQEKLAKSNAELKKALERLEHNYEQTLQQERLAAVGQLAAGIAHDFNNLLTGILGAADLLKMELPPSADSWVHAKMISESARRAAHLVQQIVDFSRKSIHKRFIFDLLPMMRETATFLTRTLSPRVTISLEATDGPFWVEGDPSQVHQILVNLALNAKDAIRDNGELRIGVTSQNVLAGTTCGGCGQLIAPGEWIVLEVADSGEGIPSDTLGHVFEPFFTTKDVGQGSGLGLSQVLGFVGQHRGHITVSSEGAGTTFAIYLPPARPLTAGAEKNRGEPPQGNGEVVLVVEDEPTARRACSQMLEHLGYRTLAAASALEALAIFDDHGEDIALLLSDVVMPDMRGDALYARVKGRFSHLKVLMMSGYPLRKTARDPTTTMNWIKKPLDLERLAEAVARTLKEPYPG